MTLLDAPSYDVAKARLRRNAFIGIVVTSVTIAAFVFAFWNWPERRVANKFFSAIEQNNFSQAFALWNNDPKWQEHPERYEAANYPYSRFVLDWGPSSDYGLIRSHKILYVTSRQGNVVLIAVEMNGRKSPIQTLAIDKKTRTICFSPFELVRLQGPFDTTYWQAIDRYR